MSSSPGPALRAALHAVWVLLVLSASAAPPGPARPTRKNGTPALGAEPESLGLGPEEHVLSDGSRAGSLVYVDAHGDLVRVKYRAGPSAGGRGFQLEQVPVGGPRRGRRQEVRVPEDVDGAPSVEFTQVLPPPVAVMRAPTPKPSDVFWQPKERADLRKPSEVLWQQERAALKKPRPRPPRW